MAAVRAWARLCTWSRASCNSHLIAACMRSVRNSRRASFCSSSGVSNDPIMVSEIRLASRSWLLGIRPGVKGSRRLPR